MYSYDNYGWYTTNQNPERSTSIEPPTPGAGQRPNWTGRVWVLATYVAPPPPAAAPLDAVISKFAFRARFTQEERVNIEMARIDVTTAPPATRRQAAALRVNRDDIAAAAFIDLSRADTRSGVQSLETAGLIAVGRAAIILNTLVSEFEKP